MHGQLQERAEQTKWRWVAPVAKQSRVTELADAWEFHWLLCLSLLSPYRGSFQGTLGHPQRGTGGKDESPKAREDRHSKMGPTWAVVGDRKARGDHLDDGSPWKAAACRTACRPREASSLQGRAGMAWACWAAFHPHRRWQGISRQSVPCPRHRAWAATRGMAWGSRLSFGTCHWAWGHRPRGERACHQGTCVQTLRGSHARPCRAKARAKWVGRATCHFLQVRATVLWLPP